MCAASHRVSAVWSIAGPSRSAQSGSSCHATAGAVVDEHGAVVEGPVGELPVLAAVLGPLAVEPPTSSNNTPPAAHHGGDDVAVASDRRRRGGRSCWRYPSSSQAGSARRCGARSPLAEPVDDVGRATSRRGRRGGDGRRPGRRGAPPARRRADGSSTARAACRRRGRRGRRRSSRRRRGCGRHRAGSPDRPGGMVRTGTAGSRLAGEAADGASRRRRRPARGAGGSRPAIDSAAYIRRSESGCSKYGMTTADRGVGSADPVVHVGGHEVPAVVAAPIAGDRR